MFGVILAAVIIFIILLVLAITPGLADRVNEGLVRLCDTFSDRALTFVGWIKNYWGMRGRQEAESRWANRNVNKEVEKRAKKLGIDKVTITDALALPLTTTPAQIGNSSSLPGTPTPMPGSQSPLPGLPYATAQTAATQPPQVETQTRTDNIKRVLVIRQQVATEYGLEIRKKRNPNLDEADKKKQGADENALPNQAVDYEWVAAPPTDSDIVTAWSLRFVYIALVLVCVAADYVFTSSRAPTVIGGGSFTPPPFLRSFFQYLPVITGVLFVAVAALSGMLIDEFVVTHSNYVKIWPFIAKPMRIIGLILAVAMFIIDVIAVIFLVIVGFAFQESLGLPLYTVLIVLVAIAIVIALGVLLAFPGLWQGLAALGLLIIGGILALGAYALALIFVVLSAIVALMGEINRLIWGRVSDPPPFQAHPDTRNLAIVGYKRGNSWAVDLCQHFAALYGANVWLAGTSEISGDSRRQQIKAFNLVRAKIITPTRSGVNASKALVQNLITNYVGKRKEEIKPLLWIAYDTELGDCLDALQDLGSQRHPDVKNVQLALLWIVSSNASDNTEIKDLAADLREWALRDDSILKTVIVYQEDAPVATTWQRKTNDVLARGLASLLGAGLWSSDNSFAAVINDLRKGGYIFSYLSAGSMGIDPAQQEFQTGFASGLTGHINPNYASDRLANLAGEMLKKQACQTVSEWDKPIDRLDPNSKPKRPASADPSAADQYQSELKLWQDHQSVWLKQQARVFVNIVVPPAKNALKKDQRKLFTEEVCDWLNKNYGISAQHVVVEPIQSDKDNGIDISNPWPEGAGEYYFSMTALRGVVDADAVVNGNGVVDPTKALPAIPHDLRDGVPSERRREFLDEWYEPAPKAPDVPDTKAAASVGSGPGTSGWGNGPAPYGPTAYGPGAPNAAMSPGAGGAGAPGYQEPGYGVQGAYDNGSYGTPAGNMGGYSSYGQQGYGQQGAGVTGAPAGNPYPPAPFSTPLVNNPASQAGTPIGNNPTIPRRMNPASSAPVSGPQDPGPDGYQNPASGAYSDANNYPWGRYPDADQQTGSDQDS